MSESPGRPPPYRRRGPLALLCLLAVLVWSVTALDLHRVDLTGTGEGIGFLLDASIPPDTGVLEIGLHGLLETLYIAFVGTLVGVALSLPVSVLATRTLFRPVVSVPARWVLAGLRVLPSILWAVIFVILVGTGPQAGVLAISLYTTGFVGKLAYEAIEDVDPGPAEAVSSLGASHLQVVRHVVLPQASAALVSHSLFTFEYNVRHASAIGIVGAGGIGYYIMGYLEFFAYDRVVVLLALVFVVVLIVDEIGYLVRSVVVGRGERGGQ